MSAAASNPGSVEGSGALSREVLGACRSLGFALAGITAARASDRGEELRAWIDAGKHGEMTWLAETADVRADPARFLGGARSIVMVADRYASKHGGESPAPEATTAGAGRVARYARGLDYHAVMKRRLHALADALRARFAAHEFRAFVDSAPVLEREHAARAGLGFIGKHTLLINPSAGSYLLLGGIATTLGLEPTTDAEAGIESTGHCGSCTRCIDACPTGAITAYSVDATRCISYLTIEHQSDIRAEFREAIGEWIFGCDVCQDVCPYNQARGEGTAVGGAVHPAYAPRRASIATREVAAWDEGAFSRETAGSALKRVTLGMLKRNAAVVEANTPAAERGGSERAPFTPRKPGG